MTHRISTTHRSPFASPLTILLMITMLVGQLLPMIPAMSVPTAHAQAEIIYVNHAATGSDNGISWANAYTDLQTALNAASSGNEIWVAKGTYYPTDGTDRTISFVLKDGVAIYGGFAGSETSRGRDWETNETILSGDIGTQGDNSDNSYHVIYNDGVANTAILDGFTVTGGNANGGAPHYYGGGMFNNNSNPSLTNVTFSGNSADNYGGGMSNYNNSSPSLTNVTFSGNSANQGGGMYNVSSCSPTLTNVIFSGNSADDTGGGISNMNSSSPSLTNVTFNGNRASNYGGGMYNWYSSSPTLTNVIFSGNRAVEGGGIYNRDNSNPTIQNSILWGNTATTRGDQIYSGTPVISHSLIAGSGGSGASWDTTLGTDNGNNLDVDPLFVNPIAATSAPTTTGDYRLQVGSPAIDVGDNSLLPTGVTTDLDGNTRIVNGTVDLGAYEAGESGVTYIIAGTVKDSLGTPLAGVTISTDGGIRTTTTNSSGTYTITGLLTNTYTIQAKKFGYTFTPATRKVSVPPNATGQDFTAIPNTATLGGKVTDKDGKPLAGVEITLTSDITSTNGMTTTTGSDGSYSFADIDVGRYRLTPYLKGYGFTPGSRTRYVPPDNTSQDFAAAPANAVELWTASNIAGDSGTVAVSGTLAFAGEGNKLHIFDVSNRLSPQLLASLQLAGRVMGIDVEGSFVYVADFRNGLQIVDVRDPRNPILRSNTFLPQYGMYVEVIGHLAYVANSYAGLRILDVSNPDNPQEIGNYADIPYAFHVDIEGDKAYVTNLFGGLYIVDITEPVTPTLVATYDTGGLRVQVQGDYAYLAYKGLRILDVSTPSQPTLVASYPVDGDAADVEIDGTIAYVSGRNHGITVFDVSNVLSATQEAYYETELDDPVQLVVQGQTLYVADALNGLHTLDISTPESLSHLSHFAYPGGTAISVAVDDTFAYVGKWNGLLVVDIQDANNPVSIFHDSSLDHVTDIAIHDHLLYLANGYNGLTIMDKTTPTNLHIIGNYDTPGNAVGIHISGQTAYVADAGKGLQIFDVSTPSTPQLLGNYTPPGETISVFVAGTTAYLVNKADGVYIVDVSDPSNAKLLGSYTPIDDNVMDVVTVGDLMYLILENGGLAIFDISDPLKPIQIGDFDMYYTWQLAVVDNFVYVAATWDGVYVIDVSDPTNPTEAGHFDTPSFTVDVTIANEMVYAADEEGGLLLLHQRIDRYTVSGTVTDDNGEPLAGVTISAGNGIPTVTTGSDGSYTLTELPKGTYTIQAEKTGYTFTPASQEVSVPPDSSGINFTVIPSTATLGGKVTDKDGTPLAGVLITINNGQKATTNASGSYTLTNVLSGTYSLTPTLEGYTFDPVSRTVTVPPSKTAQDFIATLKPYTVSGTVLDSDGNPLAFVTVKTADGHKATTNASGIYTLTNVLSGTYTFTPTLEGYTFEPASRKVTVPPSKTAQDFTATLKPYTISGTVLDSDGNPLSNVLLTLNDGRTTTTSSNGIYTLTNVLSGTYTFTPTLEGYTFEPANRKVTVPPAATGQDFTASLRADRFVVGRDGFSFDNFRYTGARWEDFKRAFPDTQMELPNGTPRKGPQRYFYDVYYNIGDGGNCAGFTAVSLIRFLKLKEGVETDLLSAEHRSINPLHDMPNPGKGPFSPRSSDIADYIHLYQARQMSWQYNQWWFAQKHIEDTPQEVFQGVQEYTERNEPVAVDVRYNKSGHRMTAYRTEQEGTMGYIYVYDNNWPDDDNRRIEVDLTTGRWSYTLSPRAGMTWSGSQPGSLRYAPGSLNFPASLPHWQATDTMLNTEVVTGTHLSIDGEATLMISDNQGRKLGFEGDTLVSEIPGAGYLPIEGFNENNPDASQSGTYFVPSGSEYTASIEPTASGSYTLTAYANGSAMSLDNITTTQGNNDTVKLANGVQDVTVETTTDTDYCQYVTLEVSETASRDYTSCVTGASDVQFSLDTDNGELAVSNNGTQDIGVNVTVDQVGDDAHNGSVTKTIGAGEESTIPPVPETGSTQNSVYLPYVGN